MKIPPLENLLFLDLETVSQKPSFSELDERGQELWSHKIRFHLNESNGPEQLYEERAGVMAEFSKIVCASFGFVQYGSDGWEVKLKSFYNEDEAQLLKELIPVLDAVGKGPLKLLCAHNGIEFDFPFLARRLVIQGIQLPECLDIAGKKPWEVPHVDTMNLWKFGDRKAYTSLNLLSYVLDIPSPKDDISGADVHRVYYEEKNLERIAKYCEKDVLTLIKVYQKLLNNKTDLVIGESDFDH